MKHYLQLSFLFLFLVQSALSQQRIDGSFPFQSDPAKKYSLYIPSAYISSVPNKLMLALHPLNTSRWDGKSWCDTLKVFAETNGLLLVSPDGGPDGAIDDPIDTAFTTVLLDSVIKWYNIDQQKIYIMGFSWGGKTTYTYGLYHASRFCGYLPIGAAINGTSEVNGFLHKATGKPFYLVHGSADSPNTRFYPIRDSLINRNAKVKYNLMNGVGHTIDFPNRNQILTVAYKWIDSVGCTSTAFLSEYQLSGTGIHITPNLIEKNMPLQLVSQSEVSGSYTLSIHDVSGKIISRFNTVLIPGINQVQVYPHAITSGIYFLRLESVSNSVVLKFGLK